MKKISFSVIFFVAAVCLFFACKKEEVNDQQFVQNHFIGRWPLKVAIFKTTKNGTLILDSTVNYGVDTPVIAFPIDTILFTNDGKYNHQTLILYLHWNSHGYPSSIGQFFRIYVIKLFLKIQNLHY